MEQKSDKKIRITASVLKTIAVVLMIINHACLLFVDKNDNGLLYYTITAVTRASFVIFAFLLAEGMYYTRSREKYLLKLFIFALISEIPFDLCFSGIVIDFSRQNVFFELAIAAGGIYLMDKYPEKYEKILIGGAAVALASVLQADYSYKGILLIFVFYYLRDNKPIMYIAAALVLFLCTLPGGITNALIQLCGIWAFVLFWLYDGTRGKQLPSMVYYWIYPVHLLILWILKILL